MLIIVGIISIAVVIVNLVCLIIVLTKLFPKEGVGMGILGIICGLYTFIWGWQNANSENIKNVMIVWSFCIGLNIVLNVLASSAAS